MKKVILVLVAFATILLITNCTKTDVAPDSPSSTVKKKKTLTLSSSTTRVVNEIDIDTDGYLIIDSLHKMDAIIGYLTTRTHLQVQDHFIEEGFSSYGAGIYGEQYWSQPLQKKRQPIMF